VLKDPPIRHRGDAPGVGLSVFEFVIAATLSHLARKRVEQTRRETAWAAGKAAMDKARNSCSFKSRVKRNDAERPASFRGRGSRAYRDSEEQFNRTYRSVFKVEVSSSSALLKAAGFVLSRRNRSRIAQTLELVSRPVCHGGRKLPPVLRGWRRLRLSVVGGFWIPPKRFDKVPWPLPTRGGGTTTLALYLFLFGLDNRRDRHLMRTDNLYRRIGIKARRPAHGERAFNRALAQVNAHLTKLKAETTFKIVRKQDGAYVDIVRAGRAVEAREAEASKRLDETRKQRREELERAWDEGEARKQRGSLLEQDLREERLREAQQFLEQRREKQRWADIIAKLQGTV
jgi:hypothetical protein